jgi:hypothetical protein
MSGQETRRHPETPSYRCFLSDLTGFAGLRRAGPTRTAVRILEVAGDVNPRYQTLGDALLISGLEGAAAMFGSTTLTLDMNEQRLGVLFMPLLTRPEMTIEQAELLAKRAMAQNDPQAIDVLLWRHRC